MKQTNKKGKIISENATNKMTALDNKLNLPEGEYLNKANAAKAQYDFGQKLQGKNLNLNRINCLLKKCLPITKKRN